MLSALDKVRLARQFIYTSGRSITDKSKLFASLLQPRRFSQEYADTPVYAPRGITKQLWRAAAVLAHVFKAGTVDAATPPPADHLSGRVNLSGVVIQIPRSEWEHDSAGSPFLGVAIRLDPRTCGAATAATRKWQLICPLEHDDQVFVFSEERLLTFISSKESLLADQEPPSSPPTPPRVCRSPRQILPLHPPQPTQLPSVAPVSQDMHRLGLQGSSSADPLAIMTPTTGNVGMASHDPLPTPLSLTSIVIYGLGSRCDATDAEVLAQAKWFFAAHLKLHHLADIRVIKRAMMRYPQRHRHPDIVVLEITEATKAAIWRAKRSLPYWCPVSIDIHRDRTAHATHLAERWGYRSAFALHSPSYPIPSSFCPRYTPASHSLRPSSSVPGASPPPPPPLPPRPASPPPPGDDGAGPSRPAPQQQRQ